jgi:oligopeptide/dipeptide ABC transporter ATP-binding protein|tara:strand:- start:1310 stop:2251 length:942 start_codon:yes stop_codon:yes gene_type:complete
MIIVKNLQKHFPIKKGIFLTNSGYNKAVNGISFQIENGSTFGLVGESGCGKTTLGRLLLRLIEPTSGEVIYNDRNIFALKKEELRTIRKEMQIVFQDTFSSLNPRMTVYDIVKEPLDNYGLSNVQHRKDLIYDILNKVGLESGYGGRFPHELSGGQRQRIAIARALILNPKFIVFDEPTSALDVSIQSKIIGLIKDLQTIMGLTCLFISHDLMVIRFIASKIAVMYKGKLVELSTKEELFNNPLHPYTKNLISAIPILEPGVKKYRKDIIKRPFLNSNSCSYYDKCEYKKEICKTSPPLREIENKHLVACYLY